MDTLTVDKESETEDDPESDEGAKQTKNDDVREILKEFPFFKIVASCEDDGRQQCVEEEFLIELYLA